MPVRVLIVDDSPFVREVLREGLSRYPDIIIVGEASDGKRAERLVTELRPDVVTMDVVMPMMGGMEAIRSIMSRCPTPIVVVSDVESDHERLALKAMDAGAIDTFAKPKHGFDRAAADQLAALLRAAAHMSVRRRLAPLRPPPPSQQSLRRKLRRIEFLGIVASTGGPQTLRRLVEALWGPGKAGPPFPIAIVQHTALGFTEALTSWLAASSTSRVSVAREGQRVDAGSIVVAPDDLHLEITTGGIVHVHPGPKLGSHRPSGTLLLRSLAMTFGPAAAGVVLTGMGDDGADGARSIEDRGGLVLVEDPASAIIEGMPRAAIERTQSPVIGTAEQIGRMLQRSSVSQGRE